MCSFGKNEQTNDRVHRVAAGGSSKTENPPASTSAQHLVPLFFVYNANKSFVTTNGPCQKKPVGGTLSSGKGTVGHTADKDFANERRYDELTFYAHKCRKE